MNQWKTWLGVLATLTFAIHLAFGLYYTTKSEVAEAPPVLSLEGEAFLQSFGGWNSEHEGDSAAYNRAAVEILRTGVPRSRTGAFFFHAPVYAYFVAACYWVGGVRLWSVLIPQAVLSGIICWLVGMIAGRLAQEHKPAAALFAAGLVLINLRMAMYVGYVSPTLLVTGCAVLALTALTREPSGKTISLFAVAVLAGCYTQAVFFVAGFAAGIWLLFAWQQTHRWLYAVAAVVLIAGATVKPLLTILGIGGGTQDSLAAAARGTFWEANNPNYESLRLGGLWERRPGNPWTHWQASGDEQRRYADYSARAQVTGTDPGLLWIRENPAQYAKLCLIRFYTALGPFTGQMSPRNRGIATVLWLLIFPVGLVELWRQRATAGGQFTWCVLACITAFCVLVILEWYLRYRMPLEIMLSAFAGMGSVYWLSRWRAGLSKRGLA